MTSDQTWIPLRWIAPELVDEVHGNLLVVDQTKESNIWSVPLHTATTNNTFFIQREGSITYNVEFRPVFCS